MTGFSNTLIPSPHFELLANMLVIYASRFLVFAWDRGTASIVLGRRKGDGGEQGMSEDAEWAHLLAKAGDGHDVSYGIRETAVAEQVVADQLHDLYLRLAVDTGLLHLSTGALNILRKGTHLLQRQMGLRYHVTLTTVPSFNCHAVRSYCALVRHACPSIF